MRLLGTLLVFLGLVGAVLGFVLALGLKTVLGVGLVFCCLTLAALGAHLRD